MLQIIGPTLSSNMHKSILQDLRNSSTPIFKERSEEAGRKYDLPFPFLYPDENIFEYQRLFIWPKPLSI